MATQTTPDVVDLVATASIDAVFLALRTPHMGTVLELTDKLGRRFEISVQGLRHEDGSGCSFLISGNAALNRTNINGLDLKRYEAYLNYKGGGRRGWIRILD